MSPLPTNSSPPPVLPLSGAQANFLSAAHGPSVHPESMKIGSAAGSTMGVARTGKQADLLWCFEPVYQRGQDIASNPRLLPATFAEHAKQIASCPRCPPAPGPA